MSTEPTTPRSSAALAINPIPPGRFHNLPEDALADALGEVEERVRHETKERDDLRAEMESRGKRVVESARFAVTKDVKTEKRFDAKAVKAKMGAAWYAGFQRPNTRTTFTVTAKSAPDLGVPA